MSTSELSGFVLAGKYTIQDEIGQGASAVVFRATQNAGGPDVAVKILLDGDSDSKGCERFNRAVTLWSPLKHRNIVGVLDHGEVKSLGPYMVMELIEGRPLDELIAEEGKMEVERAIDITRQILEGLGAAHRLDVLHRDIKPANILITRDRGGREVVKLTDFGIAKFTPRNSGDKPAPLDLTATGNILGTPRYMAPEQFNPHDVCWATDLYSTGLVFYELLAGVPAVQGDSVQSLLLKQLDPKPIVSLNDQSIPAPFRPVIVMATAKPIHERYSSAERFLIALKSAETTWRKHGPASEWIEGVPEARHLGAAPPSAAGAVPDEALHPPGVSQKVAALSQGARSLAKRLSAATTGTQDRLRRAAFGGASDTGSDTAATAPAPRPVAEGFGDTAPTAPAATPAAQARPTPAAPSAAPAAPAAQPPGLRPGDAISVPWSERSPASASLEPLAPTGAPVGNPYDDFDAADSAPETPYFAVGADWDAPRQAAPHHAPPEASAPSAPTPDARRPQQTFTAGTLNTASARERAALHSGKAPLGVRARSTARSVLALVAVLVIVAVALIGGQRFWLYWSPGEDGGTVRKLKDADWKEVTYEAEDGTKLQGWYATPTAKLAFGTLLVYPGLHDAPERHAWRLNRLRKDGYGVFVASPRGTAGSEGIGSAEHLLTDAVKSYDALLLEFPPDTRVYTYGRGVGAASAAHASRMRKVKGVIVEGASTRLSDGINSVVPGLGELVMDDVDVLDQVRGNPTPAVFFYGDQDWIAPQGHARALAKVHGRGGELRLIAGAGHGEALVEHMGSTRYVQTIAEFLGRMRR